MFNKVLFILIVIIPFVAGIAGAIAGWQSIKNNLYEKNIDEINYLLNQAKNGEREAYTKFYEKWDNLNNKGRLTQEEDNKIALNYDDLRNTWADFISKQNTTPLRLLDNEKRIIKPSMETIYDIIMPLPPKTRKYPDETIIAAYNEIVFNNYEYFIEYLYEVAISNENIYFSISAARAIAILTKYEPYTQAGHQFTSPEKSLIFDIPKFEKLKKWWKEEGSKQEIYKCPFNNLISYGGEYFFDKQPEDIRIEKLKNILDKYPKLSKTRLMMAYSLLNDKNSLDEVQKNSLESLNLTNSEPLSYLLLAFVDYKKNDIDSSKKWIRTGIENIGDQNFLTNWQINDKFHENNFLDLVLNEIDINKLSKLFIR